MVFLFCKGGVYLSKGILYYFKKPDPNRPIGENYVTEINNFRKSLVKEEDAMLYLFDNKVKFFHRLTKELQDYKNQTNLPLFEFWQIKNRVGYVLYDYEHYINELGEVKKRSAYVWRFIGFGSSCFASSKEELKKKVLLLIKEYCNDIEGRGYNAYPYYTKYFRHTSP